MIDPLNFSADVENYALREASYRMMFDNLLHDIWEIQEHLGLGLTTRNEFFNQLYDDMLKGRITPEQAVQQNYKTTNAMLKQGAATGRWRGE